MAVSIRALLLNCPDPARTAAFFVQAFACVSDGKSGLRLGAQHILLRQARSMERRDFAGFEAGFQHFAIAVPDMANAMRRLGTVRGWTAISRHGSELLPASSGGATAFKFRDPDGHPLELLQFRAGATPRRWQGATATFAGIDHSAISVADTARSVAFYAALGFVANKTQLNKGPEQARLDGLDVAVVEVTALGAPDGGAPHLELLCYRHPPPSAIQDKAGSVAATELTLAAPARVSPARVKDPDGHRILLVPTSSGGGDR